MPDPLFGVFATNPASPASIWAFESWVPRKVGMVVENGDWSEGWAKLESSLDWQARGHKAGGYPVMWGIPIFPAQGGCTLWAAARGDYDTHYSGLAKILVARGFKGSYIRIGWEANGNWMPWSAAKDVHSFKVAFARVADVFRLVDPSFRFVFCTTLGQKNAKADEIIPDLAHVDVINVDVYDEWWSSNFKTNATARWTNDYWLGTYKLLWFLWWAKDRGKKLSIAEWGLRPDWDAGGHGGGDNPYFIEQMKVFIDRAAADGTLLMHAYFEKGDHRLMSGKFPKAAAAFQKAFKL